MQKTEWRGPECPPLYEERLNGGQKQLTIYIDVRESNEDLESTEKEWVATQIRLPLGVLDYGSIVSALINAKYSNDSMQAVVNNHLLDDGDPDHEAAYNDMQEYRVYAKETAREIVKELNKQKEGKNE